MNFSPKQVIIEFVKGSQHDYKKESDKAQTIQGYCTYYYNYNQKTCGRSFNQCAQLSMLSIIDFALITRFLST